MIRDHIMLAILWMVFGVLHSVLAGTRFKERVRRTLGSAYKFYPIYYSLFSFVFLVCLLYYQISMKMVYLYRPRPLVFVPGILVGASGLALMGVCSRKYFLSVSGLGSLIKKEDRPSLMVNGIHRYVRHPLYLGTFSFVWGLFLVLPVASLLITNTIITIYTLIGIKLEEEKLIMEFGEGYRQYRKNVPKLIPHLKFNRKHQA